MHSCTVNKYANACFNVVQEAKAFPFVNVDLRALKEIFEKYSSVFERMDCPTMSARSRVLFIQKLFLGLKFHKITKNLLSILAEYGVLSSLGNVIKEYFQLHLRFQKELMLDVISVQALKNEELKCIKDFFHKEFKRKITVRNTLDTSILGGLIIKTGSFVLDGSVANRLKSLEFILQNELN